MHEWNLKCSSTNLVKEIIAIISLFKISWKIKPNIWNGLEDINQLKSNQYSWVTNTNIKLKSQSQTKIIDKSKVFSPWKLVQREN